MSPVETLIPFHQVHLLQHCCQVMVKTPDVNRIDTKRESVGYEYKVLGGRGRAHIWVLCVFTN